MDIREKILEELKKKVLELDGEGLKEAAREALKVGLTPREVIQEGIQKGMGILGDRFRLGECFLPELCIAADIVQPVISELIEKIPKEEKPVAGKVVIGTIYGDIHDIGKNIVAAFLRLEGYEVQDLGSDVPVMEFVKKAEETGADIVAISALLSPSIPYQRDVIKSLRDRGISTCVILGGAAVSPEWVRVVGADAYGRTAEDAVKACNILMKERDKVERPLIVEGK